MLMIYYSSELDSEDNLCRYQKYINLKMSLNDGYFFEAHVYCIICDYFNHVWT